MTTVCLDERSERGGRRVSAKREVSQSYHTPGEVLEAAPPALSGAELANSVTHGMGFVLSLAGAVLMVVLSFSHGDFWRAVGCSVFAFTLVAVYAASTLSHGFTRPDLRRLFRILDQAFIYLLIVGSYTPWALAYLRTSGWLLFLAVLWTGAFCGFLSKVLFSHRVESVAVWTCLLLGWLPGLAVPALATCVPSIALWYMLFGGVFYSLGTIFLVFDNVRPYFHAIWHVLVIGGSAFHFVAILYFVALSPMTV
jgi:hemolysin III